MKNYFLLIFFFFFFLKKITSTNYISFKRVYEKGKFAGTYIRPAISEDGYLYIITGENTDENEKGKRYIIKYDINTAKYIKTITYESNYGFWRGEPHIIGSKSQYLFITTYWEYDGGGSFASFEFFNLNNELNYQQKNYRIHGYRRDYKKAGSYYYLMYLDNVDYSWRLGIRKMTLTENDNYFPTFNDQKTTSSVQIRYQAMISCDLTADYKFILCAYFYENTYVEISVFNDNLDFLLSRRYIAGEFVADNFVKIIYLKDNSDFILMTSQTPKITRLRYFRYLNSNIIDKLSPIIKSSNDYLDIYDTQFNGHDGENDIMAYDSNKVIKIHNYNTSLIIIIIQLYDNDSSMSIKYYKMEMEKGNIDMCQNRITMLKNSFVVCASATKDGLHTPGYFFINFPNSTDINLNNNKIAINQIISLESAIFSVSLKLKILSIPTDFIFISAVKSTTIKINDELELNDQLTLRQFRINGGSFILNFVSIARGTDAGYTKIIKYPSNAAISNNEVFLEGRKGQITINFNSCLSGYYRLEYDINLCTNVCPYGYYLDINNKMYRKCPSSCDECNAPINSTYMNCKSCKQGYYITEDTNSCYNYLPENYYLDGNILRRCHQKCLHCSKGSKDNNNMKCTSCYTNYYLTEDTKSCYNTIPDNYYLDGNILRRCHSKCLHCSTGSKDDNNMKCTTCFANYYLTEDTNSCYNNIPDNYYLDGDILRRCHKNCFHCSTSSKDDNNMKCTTCYTNYYLTEDTNSCYNTIPDNYYLDGNILRRCHPKCLHCSTGSKDDNNMKCTTCYSNYFLTEDTESCYNTLPDNYYLDGDILRRCHKNCLHCSTGSKDDNHMNCTKCFSDYYLTEDTNSCYTEKDNYYRDGDILRRCYKKCLQCSSHAINMTFMNCLKCYQNWYLTEDSYSCYNEVIDNYYLSQNNTLKKCHKNCLRCTTNEHSNNYMNCTRCIQNFYMTEDTESCYEEGIDNYYLENNILKRCHKNCLKCSNKETNDTFMNCISCQKNLYLTEDTKSCYGEIINNYYLENNILKKCHPNCLQCFSAPKNDTHMNCKKCKDNFYMTEDTNSCYNEVINNYYLENDILKKCHPNCLQCSSSSKNDNEQNCKKCKDNFYLTEDTNSCYDFIPNNYFLEKDSLKKCYYRCSNCIGGKNEGSMNCLGCTSEEYFYKEDTNDCILKDEYKKRDLEFKITDNYNFYIFICVILFALIIFILICLFYKSNREKNQQEQQNKQDKKDQKIQIKEEYKQNDAENIELEILIDTNNTIN